MLLVRTHIAPSSIHGLGVFASEPIPAGAQVWKFTPTFDLDLDPVLLDAQPPECRRVLLHYGYVDHQINRYILCCDDARFINHSTSPTLATIRDVDQHGIDVAVRDIGVGEELTLDYLNEGMPL